LGKIKKRGEAVQGGAQTKNRISKERRLNTDSEEGTE